MARITLQECCDQARELIDKRQYADAIAVCRHILKRYPRHIRTYQILGEACLEKGEHAEAIDIFKRLLENADPENFASYAGLGVAYEEKGQLPEAIWYMERAVELAPNNEETRNTLRRLYRQRDGVEPDRIRHSKAALARLYARGGQYRQAIEELRELLGQEDHRNRLDVKISLAETLWHDGRREQASELAREILQTAPDCLKAILLLGKIAIEKGRPEEGTDILERTRGLDPENRAAQALFGESSPLPPQTILIPMLMPETASPATPPVPAEASAEPATEEIAAETAITLQETAEATELAPAVPEEVEAIPEVEPPTAEAPVAVVEPLPTAATEEAVVAEPVAEEVAPSDVEPPALPEVPEAAPVTAAEQAAEEAAAMALEPTTPPVAEETAPAVTEAVAPVEKEPKKKRSKRSTAEATTLAAATEAAAGPLSDIERYRLLLEQKPKDDELRLALARAYRDGSQMRMALEQYAGLVHAKQKLLPEIIADVEGIVASRPDNLDAHELLADLYARNGQLPKALERYRWVMERLQAAN